jgi:hypothetical protein
MERGVADMTGTGMMMESAQAVVAAAAVLISVVAVVGSRVMDKINKRIPPPPCGEPPWEQVIGPNGIFNRLLNPIGVEHTWTGDRHSYTVTKPGSFTDFEGRVKANGWENFSTDPHPDHWGDNDYRKQYNGEWYHLSMKRPGSDFNPDIAGPARFSLHWEEAKPGSTGHFLNFLGSKLSGIPIKAFNPCTPKVVGSK